MEDDNKRFYKTLFAVVFPAAFQQLMVAIVGASDAIMLGAIDQDSLSAVSLAAQVMFVFSLFLCATIMGTNIFAAQYWGKNDKKTVEKLLGYTVKISFAVSVVFFIGTTFMPTSIMKIFTSEQLLIDYGAKYLRIVGTSYIMMSISEIYICIMKNCGKALKSTAISSVSVLINIILNAILIYGLFGMPAMGISGAAIATVISKIVELTWVLVEASKKESIRFHLKYILHTEKQMKSDFWKYAVPIFGNQIVWGFGFTMYSVIMGHLGNDAVAANSIANIAKNLTSSFCMGIGIGGGIIVGNELGRGNLELAKSYGKRVCKMSVISGIITGCVLLALIPAIVHFTNLSEQASEYLKWMLVMCSYYLFGKSINATTIAGIFCAGGDSRFGFICDAITMWAVTVPLGMIAAFVLKLPVIAVYFFITLDEIVKLPAVFRHYRKYLWVKDLTRDSMKDVKMVL